MLAVFNMAVYPRLANNVSPINLGSNLARFVGFSILMHCSVHSHLNIVPLECILIDGSTNTPILSFKIFSRLFLSIFFSR